MSSSTGRVFYCVVRPFFVIAIAGLACFMSGANQGRTTEVGWEAASAHERHEYDVIEERPSDDGGHRCEELWDAYLDCVRSGFKLCPIPPCGLQ